LEREDALAALVCIFALITSVGTRTRQAADSPIEAAAMCDIAGFFMPVSFSPSSDSCQRRMIGLHVYEFCAQVFVR